MEADTNSRSKDVTDEQFRRPVADRRTAGRWCCTPGYDTGFRARDGGGPVRFTVGWGDEPTYTGLKNSVHVTITEASGTPVADLGDTLEVEVIKGPTGRRPLVANFRVGQFGTPGATGRS